MLPKLLKLETIKGEKRWTYELLITFNNQSIIQLTITDHYQVNHPQITNVLIWKVMKKLNGLRREETDYRGKRKVFKWEETYQNKKYRIIFWFDDHNSNGLWIRNCYPID